MNPRSSLQSLTFLFLIACLPVSVAGQNILYVDSSHAASGTVDGTSWESAYKHLQNALSKTDSMDIDEIWVAAGTYYPDEGNAYTEDDRGASFHLRNNLKMYGGFSGGESVRGDRDPQSHSTILSGKITQSDSAHNSYHVVKGIEVDSTAVLDGFTIQFGRAWPEDTASADSIDVFGAGLYLSNASPRLRNLVIKRNIASGFGGAGGGMYIHSGSPSLVDSKVISNAAITGGGIFNDRGAVTLKEVTLASNGINQLFGGTAGMASSGSLNMTKVTFQDHFGSSEDGDAALTATGTIRMKNVSFVNNDGGVGIPVGLQGNVTMRDVLFQNNEGVDAGALRAGGEVTMHVVQFIQNSAHDSGGALQLSGQGNTTIVNAMFAGNKTNTHGGAIAGTENHHLTLLNTVFSGNRAENTGGALRAGAGTYEFVNVTMNANKASSAKSFSLRDSAHINLKNTVVWDTETNSDQPVSHFGIDTTVTGGFTHSHIQDSLPTELENRGGNLTRETAFGWPEGTDGTIGTGDDNLKLRRGAPGIDHGSNTVFPDSITVDFRGDPRIQNDTIDIGAYEGGTIIDDIPREKQVPDKITLLPNYPNPFNPSTTIQYKLPRGTHVSLTVYNAVGRKITTLVNDHRQAGTHQTTFNAEGLASGLYIYRLKTPEQTISGKMLLVE